MSEHNISPDDGVEDEFVGWMNAIRSGRDRWRGRGVAQRRRRSRINQRTRGMNTDERSATLRKDATARLIAALEAKHHALDIERERERTRYPGHDRTQPSPEEIRRQATSVDREDVQMVKASQIAGAHVIAQRERLMELGLSSTVVGGMINQYEQELIQARNDALSTEQSANSAEDLATERATAPAATTTPDDSYYAGEPSWVAEWHAKHPSALDELEEYTAQSLDQVDELSEAGRDRSLGDLIADSGIESGMAVNSSAVDTEATNVIDLAAARSAERNLDEGVQI